MKGKRTDTCRPRFEKSECVEWQAIAKKLKEIGVNDAMDLVFGASKHFKETREFKGDTLEVKQDATPIKTQQELEKSCNIDLDIWESTGFRFSSWNTGGVKNGLAQLYSVKGTYQKRKTGGIDSFLSRLEKGLYKIPKCTIKPPKINEGGLCAIINVYDAHLDKVTRATETGEFSDIGSNCKLFKEAFYSLLDHVDNPTQIIFPIGNDLFNVNDTRNTTKKGTPQDTVLHHSDAFEIVLDLMIKLIDHAAKKAPVLIPMIAGNHDTDAVHQLGLVLSRIYRDVEHVTIDYSRIPRKYLQYGKNMFMFEHGDGLKTANIPLTMAQERAQMWADTKHRYCFLGHLHHTKTIQFQRIHDDIGVQVMHLRAMSPKDKWHFKKGYIGIHKSAELILTSLDGVYYSLIRKTF